nr:MlaD family protein [Aldersonia kunmingensis]
MRTRKALVMFSLFAIVALSLTYIMWSTLLRSIDGETNEYTATFTDVLGLRSGDDVRMAGVRVGRIESIDLDDANHPRVTFKVQSDQHLYGNTKALVRYQNLIGQRYVALVLGPGEAEPLPDGGEIPLERTEGSFDISSLLGGFQPLFSMLQPDQVNSLADTLVQALQGDGVSLSALITEAAGLASTFEERDAILGSVIDNLGVVLAGLANRSTELQTLIAQTRSLVDGLYSQGELLKISVDTVAGSTDSLVQMIGDVKPGIARASDTATTGIGLLIANGAALDRAAIELPEVLTGLARFTSFGAYGNAYLCTLDVSLWGVLLPRGIVSQVGGTQHSEVCR